VLLLNRIKPDSPVGLCAVVPTGTFKLVVSPPKFVEFDVIFDNGMLSL
jgi:hypothetical protein